MSHDNPPPTSHAFDILKALTALTAIPKFFGNDPPRINYFFSQYDIFSVVKKWSPEKKKELLSICLAGTALDFFYLLQIDQVFPAKAYDQVK